MADRPIIFSGPMVRALLDGRKTMTRRVLKPQPPDGARYTGIHFASDEPDSWFFNSPHGAFKVRQRFEEGDRLWVREAWHAARSLDSTPPRDIPRDADIEHAATARSYAEIGLKGKLRPGMFLPRWASRLTMTVTAVKVERLQDISEEDARAEGAGLYVPGHGFITDGELCCDPGYSNFLSPRMGFETVWSEIHGPDAWAANPWVAAVSFTVERRNIDPKEQPHG